jgi:xylulokinase
MYLLGIDFGTGGGKAAIIDENADVLGYGFEEYEIITEKPGWSEHNAEEYWNVACRVIKAAIKESKINPADIKGIALSSALPSMVMVDKDGNPLGNAYNLMDRRAKKEVRILQETLGEEELFKITGNRLDDHPALVNILWEKENRPEIFKNIYKVLTTDGFIRMKLTGTFNAHYSAAPFYGVAYNLKERRFHTEILDKIGIPSSILPELFRCEEIVGSVTDSGAKDSGLIAGIPVAAGQVDCNAGWMGAGAIEPGDTQMNLGTCGNFGIIQDGSLIDSRMINFAYTTDSENTYITVPTTTTGGQLIRYMRDNFYKSERLQEKDSGINTYDIIDSEAAAVPPGAEGLIVLPYLMGERTPIWDTDARGTIFGLSLNHTRGHVVRAMMESVAFALYDSYSILKERGVTIKAPLILNEGGAKSRLWRQIITDVFNIPTAMVESRVGAPFGDAFLAGIATGVFKDYSLTKKKTRYVDHLEPNPENHKLYQEYFELYKDLYTHLKDDYKKLAALRDRKS